MDNFDIVLCDRVRLNSKFSILTNDIKEQRSIVSNRKINRAYRRQRKLMTRWSKVNG